MIKKEFPDNSPKNEHLANPTVELEMKHRLLDVQELGRICPNETPDYIGNFFGLDIDLGSNRPKGIFELTITEENENGNFKGIIKDCFGNASVVGNKSECEFNFVKHYIPEESSIESSKKDLFYESFSSPDFKADMVGEWRYEDQKRTASHFWMLGFKRHK